MEAQETLPTQTGNLILKRDKMKANLPTKLRRTLFASPLCFAIFLFPIESPALTPQEVSNPRQVNGGWVTDTADILTDASEAKLNQMIDQLEAKNGTEIAVVTVPETAPSASPKEFTTELFNYWGIGKKGKDNGVLFLISVGDRRVEIETGYGIERILPNAKVGNIINAKITPRFKQGDFDGGTIAGTTELVAVLADANFEAEPRINAKVETKKIAPISGETKVLANDNYQSKLRINANVIWRISWIFGGLVSTVISYGSIPLISKKKVFIEPVGITQIQDSEKLDEGIYGLSYLGSSSLVFTLMILLLSSGPLSEFVIFTSLFAGLIVGFPISYTIAGNINENKQKKLQQECHCSHCKTKLKKLDLSQLSPHLTQAQQVASEIGSVQFEGWQCPNCSQDSGEQKIHIFTQTLDSDRFYKCPNCHEPTVERTKNIVKLPQGNTPGERLIIHECHFCDYRQEKKETFPWSVSSSGGRRVGGRHVAGGGFVGGGGGGFGGGDGGGGGGGGFGGGDSGGGGEGGGF